MSEDRNIPAVEKVKKPILHTALLCSQLIDSISQKIRGRTPELVSPLGKEDDSCPTISPRFGI